MPQMPSRELPIGSGGVAAEMGTMDPRRARKRVSKTPRRQAQEPPPDDEMTPAQFRKLMEPSALPGRRGTRTGKIRWGHRVVVEGRVAFCHSFTVPAATHEAVRQGEPLRAEGVTLPDGRPVVPKGADPTAFAVRCASCGAEQIQCREMVFLEE